MTMTALVHRRSRHASVPDALLRRWQRWTLARQFAVCASVVLLPAMVLTGVWVTTLVEGQVTRNSAAAATLYIESVVDPLVQELGTGDHISPANRARLQRLLDETSLGRQVHSFVIWHWDGRVAFSSRRELIGKSFQASSRQREAWQGTVSAKYNKHADADHAAEHSDGTALTEVYVPIRERGSERVIAVAEFYQNAHTLQHDIADARRQAWLRIGGMSLAMLTALFFIVRQGSRTIETQRQALRARIDDLVRLLRDNAELRARVEQASARASESNEFYLKRLGADLHDGPAQLLGLALLAFDDDGSAPKKMPQRPGPSSALRTGPTTGEIVAQALRELRQLAAGLALPDIATMTVESAIRAAVRRHEELSGTRVAVDLADLPRDAVQAVKICTYRVVQEGLTNALKHAGGVGQRVSARGDGGFICVEVADSGHGLSPRPGDLQGFGMRAMRDRVEILGGGFGVTSSPGNGTRIVVRLPLVKGDERDAR